MNMTKAFALVVLGWLTAGSQQASADIFSVGAFAGPLAENWESPPVFLYGSVPSPTGIMGGAASISSTTGPMTVFTHGFFGLGTSGQALPSDGIQAVGLNDGSVFGHPYPTASINWSAPIASFGGYFGATTPNGTATTLTVKFYDPSATLIDSKTFTYLRPGDGVLEWHGWTSSVLFSSVSVTGNFLALDELEASVVAVPEPAVGLLLVLPVVLMLVRKAQLTILAVKPHSALHLIPAQRCTLRTRAPRRGRHR